MNLDRAAGSTFYMMFTTRAFASGIPTVLSGTPVVSAYEDGSTTQITAGITLGVDHDSVVGLNLLTIVATTGNGYEAGKDYNLVVTTGTVGGVSVVGEIVGGFSLDLSSASGKIDTAQDDLDIITDTDGVILGAAGVDLILDEVNTAGAHNVTNSLGKQIREATGALVLSSGDCPTSGSHTTTNVVLKAAENATDNVYNTKRIVFTAGTNIGFDALIIDYDGAAKACTVSPALPVACDNTTDYEIVSSISHSETTGGGYNGRVHINTVTGTAGTSINFNGIDTRPVDNFPDAVTLAAAIGGSPNYQISSDSTLAPSADVNDSNVFGIGYTLNLGGYDYAGTHVYHASPVNGIATTAGSSDHFDILDSIIDTMTSDDTHMTNCIFIGTYTFGTSGIVSPVVNINHCKSGIAGSSSPVFTKTSGATLTCSFRDWKGGLTINGLESGDTLTIGGNELGTITLNGADASVEIRGIAKAVTNNLTGSPTVNTDGVVIGSDVAGIKTTADQITFTVANQVDSNAKSMNDTAITGAGTTADPWT